MFFTFQMQMKYNPCQTIEEDRRTLNNIYWIDIFVNNFRITNIISVIKSSMGQLAWTYWTERGSNIIR